MKQQPRHHTSSLLLSVGGGVRLRALIVLITLCVVGAAIYVLLHQFGQKQQIVHRKALAISEYGLMIALQHVQTEHSAIDDIPRTDYDDGWYKVSFNRYTVRDTLFCAIRAEGHAGSAAEQRECILRQSILGNDTSWVRQSMR
jgi:hypothetical protein